MRKQLPASITDALQCPEADQIKRLAECLKLEMERIHRCEFRVQVAHQHQMVMVVAR
jgi:hypothetical protein